MLPLVRRREAGDGGSLGECRMRWALERLEREGSPLMHGAAGAVCVLLGQAAQEAFGERLGSWVGGAATPMSQWTWGATCRTIRRFAAERPEMMEQCPELYASV